MNAAKRPGRSFLLFSLLSASHLGRTPLRYPAYAIPSAASAFRSVSSFRRRSAVSGMSSSSVVAAKPAITFVTGNKKKLEEVQQILSSGTSLPFEITNEKIDLPELQGEPMQIAAEKCKLAAERIGGAVLTEDTSLCFNALNGMPGPYIKWFLDKCGHDGLNRMLDGFDDRTAYAQTVVAFSPGPNQEITVFDGRTDGTIVRPRGSLDFGWDPVFQPDESGGKTYAEMTKEAKNAISHRGRSFAKLRAYLLDNVDALRTTIKKRKVDS